MRKIPLPEAYKPRKIRRPALVRRDSETRFWHAHAHSHYSCGDALPAVKDMVATASSHGQDALALTDHGNMGGAVQLYQECKKRGMAPFPGIEAYFKPHDGKDEPRFHLGLVAFTTEGYQALVRLTSRSHTRERFHHKPHMTFEDFAEFYDRGWTSGLALFTGCYFGWVQQSLVNGGSDAAKSAIQALATFFPHTFVELQNHNIVHEGGGIDEQIVRDLRDLAHQLDLPCIITQDAHYCHPEDKSAHDTLKRLVSWGPDPDDAVFPGDSFHLADEGWVAQHHSGAVWADGMYGLKKLRGMHSLVIPELETYHYNIPVVTVGDPQEELHEICIRALERIPVQGSFKGLGMHYVRRFEEEMEVIEFTRMASYLLLVKEVTDWCDDNGVFYQARGSASGSLVCYLLGITQVNPMEWNLRYERFLSKDRTKPPDVDLDIEDARRGELLAWLRRRFNVCPIGTYSTYSVNMADGRGSLVVAYISKRRKQGQSVDHISSIMDLPVEDQWNLRRLSDCEAKKAYGTHAAGLVITSTKEEFERLVPTMLIPSSDTTVTQYEMDDVEALGLVKLDVLGLRTLSKMARVNELVGRERNDFSWIPLNDKDTFRMLRKGATEGVFQLDGYTARRGCQEMRVKTLDDLIVLMALYRPATMSTGVKDSYVQRRAGWESVPSRHEILNRNLSETFGLPVFQEQVIAILRDLGFSPDELTEFLKAVKASNKNIGDAGEVIKRYWERFNQAAYRVGFTAKDTTFAWDAIEGFAEYGFNRSHATQYGLTAYRDAFLKKHHSLKWATGLLETSASTPREKDYIVVVKNMGVRMLPPDVNVSGFSWTLDKDRDAVRKGLLSIKGVGEKAASEIAVHAPYDSVEDLIERCDARAVNGGKSWHKDGTLNGVLLKLKDAGALKSLGVRP